MIFFLKHIDTQDTQFLTYFYYKNSYYWHDVQRTVFRYAQKACGKGFFGGKLFFFDKNFQFLSKKITSLRQIFSHVQQYDKNYVSYVSMCFKKNMLNKFISISVKINALLSVSKRIAFFINVVFLNEVLTGFLLEIVELQLKFCKIGMKCTFKFEFFG